MLGTLASAALLQQGRETEIINIFCGTEMQTLKFTSQLTASVKIHPPDALQLEKIHRLVSQRSLQSQATLHSRAARVWISCKSAEASEAQDALPSLLHGGAFPVVFQEACPSGTERKQKGNNISTRVGRGFFCPAQPLDVPEPGHHSAQDSIQQIPTPVTAMPPLGDPCGLQGLQKGARWLCWHKLVELKL